MLRIGLTGGIGAGKSTVSAALVSLGARLIDADVVARDVVAPGSAGLAEVVAAFGSQLLLPDGTLDRPALGQIVFADDEARARLNAILHPKIGLATAMAIAAAPQGAILVHDVPLLIENGLAATYHAVMVVHAPAELRLQRLETHRGMSPADARARMSAQATDEQRLAAADLWIENTGTTEQTQAQVALIWEQRLLPFAANLAAGQPATADQPATISQPATSSATPGQPPSPPEAALTRTIARLKTVTGARGELTAEGADSIRLTWQTPAAAKALGPALDQLGFPAEPAGQWRGSCDPGQSVRVYEDVLGHA